MATENNLNPENQVRVWDPFVRLFHWTLVLSFFTAYLTEDDFMSVHVWAGYVVLALVSTRIIWGFIGSDHARFADFVYLPATIIGYIKDVLTMSPRRYLGHNPAGGAMIVLMIICLLAVTTSGMALYGADQHAGPLAGLMAGAGHNTEEVLEGVHEFLANFTVFLVFVHVSGVLIESLLHKENLVRSMITGNKRA